MWVSACTSGRGVLGGLPLLRLLDGRGPLRSVATLAPHQASAPPALVFLQPQLQVL